MFVSLFDCLCVTATIKCAFTHTARKHKYMLFVCSWHRKCNVSQTLMNRTLTYSDAIFSLSYQGVIMLYSMVDYLYANACLQGLSVMEKAFVFVKLCLTASISFEI